MIRQLFNKYFSSDRKLTSYIEGITGITPNNLDLYRQVFHHRSKFTEPEKNNERLELLGDAVLDAIICDSLYKKYPYKEEGFLTELRSRIVNRKSLNEVGARLGLIEHLQFSRKSIAEASRDLGGNTFEALVGALYLDAGFDNTRRFIQKRVLHNLIDIEELEQTNNDYKSQIYHYIQREGIAIDFKVSKEITKNRRAYFFINLEMDGKVISSGEGYSKKVAEQNAAMNAITILKLDGLENGRG